MDASSKGKRFLGRNLLGLLGLSALLDKVAAESAWHAQAEKEKERGGGRWAVGGVTSKCRRTNHVIAAVCVCVWMGAPNVMLRHNLLLEVKNCQAHSTFMYSNKIELFEVIAFY